jgi:SAM-dependent methyltransferase
MSDAPIEARMRADWNDRAARDFMRYTCGVETGREEDYAAAARRDEALILKYLGGADTRAWAALDVGCGVGRLIERLAPRFRDVHGVDVSDEMLRRAGERLKGVPNVRLHRIEGTHLRQFPDASFQCVWSYSVFYHLPRPVFYGYVPEVARVCAPGAEFIFQVSQYFTPRRWLQAVLRVEPDPSDTNRRRFYTKGELRRLAAGHGFQVLAIEPGPERDLWCHWRRRAV